MAAKTTIQIIADTSKAQKGINLLGRSVADLADTAKKTSGAFATFKGFVGAQALIGGLKSIGSAAKGMFDTIAENTLLLETLTTELETMTGSASEAASVMQDLQEFSATTPFQLEGIAKASKQLIAFGFEAKTITSQLKAIGDVAAGSGSQLSDISLIFGQVAAAGKLTGERLLQFQERAVPIGPALAETLGIAEESVKDFVSKGKVDFETFEKAFRSLSGKGGIFFDSMIDKSKTASGVISTLKDNVALFASDIGKAFLPAFKEVAKFLTEFIQNNRKKLAVDITEFVRKSIIKLIKLLPFLAKSIKVGFVTTVNGLKIVMNDLGSAIDIVGASMAGLARITAATAFGYKTLFGTKDEIEEFRKAWEDAKTAQEGFGQSIIDARHETESLATEIKDAFSEDAISPELLLKFEKLKISLEKIKTEIKGIPDKKKTEVELDADANFDGFWKSFEESGEKALKGLATSIGNVLVDGTKGTRKVLDEIAEIEKKQGLAQSKGDKKQYDELALERENAEKRLQELKDEGAKKSVITTASHIASIWSEGAGKFIEVFGELSSDPEAFKEFFNGLVIGIPDIIDAFIEGLPEIIDTIIENLPAIATALVSGTFRLFAAGFSIQIDLMKRALVSVFESTVLSDAIDGWVEDIGNEVKKATVGAAKEFVFSLMGYIKEAFDDFFGVGNNSDAGIGGSGVSPQDVGRGIIAAQSGGLSEVARQIPGIGLTGQSNQSSINSERTQSILAQILKAVSAPVQATSSVTVNESVFADIIVDLNRDNRRLS